MAIETALTLSYVYSLPLSETKGLMSNLLQLHNYQTTISEYTTLCRRNKTLDVSKKLRKWNRKENMVFAIVASGLKCLVKKNGCNLNTEQLEDVSSLRYILGLM